MFSGQKSPNVDSGNLGQCHRRQGYKKEGQDEKKKKFHEDSFDQILQIESTLLDITINRYKSKLAKEKPLTEMDEYSLLCLLEPANELFQKIEEKGKKGEKINFFLKSYSEFTVLLWHVEDSLFQAKNLESIKKYFNNIFSTKLGETIQGSIGKELHKDTNSFKKEHHAKYNKIFKDTIKALEFSEENADPETIKGLKNFQTRVIPKDASKSVH